MHRPFADGRNVFHARTLPVSRRRFGALCAVAPWMAHSPAQAVPGAGPPGRDDFPKVVLVNQHNRPLRYYDDLIQGRHTVAINFIFAQCSEICATTTANLAGVQELLGDRLGRQVKMVSVSIDPLHDSPAVLKAYAANFGVRDGWHFLTGRAQDIERVRRHLGVYDRDPEKDRDISQHTGMVVYGNEARGRWGRVSAMADPRRIFDSITRWS
jgi:protein SCO1/2